METSRLTALARPASTPDLAPIVTIDAPPPVVVPQPKDAVALLQLGATLGTDLHAQMKGLGTTRKDERWNHFAMKHMGFTFMGLLMVPTAIGAAAVAAVEPSMAVVGGVAGVVASIGSIITGAVDYALDRKFCTLTLGKNACESFIAAYNAGDRDQQAFIAAYAQDWLTRCDTLGIKGEYAKADLQHIVAAGAKLEGVNRTRAEGLAKIVGGLAASHGGTIGVLLADRATGIKEGLDALRPDERAAAAQYVLDRLFRGDKARFRDDQDKGAWLYAELVKIVTADRAKLLVGPSDN